MEVNFRLQLAGNNSGLNFLVFDETLISYTCLHNNHHYKHNLNSIIMWGNFLCIMMIGLKNDSRDLECRICQECPHFLGLCFIMEKVAQVSSKATRILLFQRIPGNIWLGHSLKRTYISHQYWCFPYFHNF